MVIINTMNYSNFLIYETTMIVDLCLRCLLTMKSADTETE